MSGSGPVPQSGGNVRFGAGNPNPQMDMNRRVGGMYGGTNAATMQGMGGSFAGAVNNALNIGGGIPQQQQQQPPRGNLAAPASYAAHTQGVNLQGTHRTAGPIPGATGVGSMYGGNLGISHTQGGLDVAGQAGASKGPGNLSTTGVNMSKLAVPRMGNISAPPGLYGPNFSSQYSSHTGHATHTPHAAAASRPGPTGAVLNPTLGPMSQPNTNWVQRAMHPEDPRGFRIPPSSAAAGAVAAVGAVGAVGGMLKEATGVDGALPRPMQGAHGAPAAQASSAPVPTAAVPTPVNAAAREAEVVKAFNDPMQYRTVGLKPLVEKDSRATDGVLLTRGIDLSNSKIPLGSSETVCNALGIPWATSPFTPDPQFSLPVSYRAKQPALKTGHMEKFHYSTLLYMFYGMTKDLLQAYAAKELASRGWHYNTELKLWFIKDLPPPITPGVSNALLQSTPSTATEGDTAPASISKVPPTSGYYYFDINTWSCQPYKSLSKEALEANFMKPEDYTVRQNVVPVQASAPGGPSSGAPTGVGLGTGQPGVPGMSGVPGLPSNPQVQVGGGPHLGQQHPGAPYGQGLGGIGVLGSGKGGPLGSEKHTPN